MPMETTDLENLEVVLLVEALRDLRISQGLSQKAMAQEMGITQPNYWQLETGRSQPKVSTLQVWARALGYKIDLRLVKDDMALERSLDLLFGIPPQEQP